MSHRALGVQFMHHTELAALPTHDYGTTTVGKVLPHMEQHALYIDEDDEWQHGGPAAHVEHLKADIAQHGIREPLVVQQNHTGRWLADGHHRALAAIDLKLDRVPYRIHDL